MHTSALAIKAHGLRKTYGEEVVLDGIDIQVPEGTIYSLLGPNGAGKTTTVKVLTTLTRADEGTATVAGFDVHEEPSAVRSHIGVTGQFSAVDELLTGRENLVLMGELHHLSRRRSRERADEMLARFELTDAGNRTAATYSGGMLRRLDLAMTLIGEPRVIFLDEPTTGLDPRSRRHVWRTIETLVADGVTVFLTTQYLEEADHLAHRIGVLDHGRIVAEGTPDELKRLVPGGHVKLQFANRSELHTAAAALSAATSDDENLTLAVPSNGDVQSLRTVLDLLDSVQIDPTGLSVHTPDLDDVFLTLTGHTTAKENSR